MERYVDNIAEKINRVREKYHYSDILIAALILANELDNIYDKLDDIDDSIVNK